MTSLFVILLLSIVNSNGKNIILKFIGDTGTISLSYLYREIGNSTSMLNNKNRTVIIETETPQFIKCDDFSRNTLIYAEPDEQIEIDIMADGLISYSSKQSSTRKFESEFINDCFRQYGSCDELIIKKIQSLTPKGSSQKKIIALNSDEDYLAEKILLDQYYKKGEISPTFYKSFHDLFWSLSISNKLRNRQKQDSAMITLKNSFQSCDKLLNIPEYRMALLNYLNCIIKKNNKTNDLYNTLLIISNEFINQNIIDYLSYNKLKFNLLHLHKPVGKKTLNLFFKICKNKVFSNEIKTDYSLEIKLASFKEIISMNNYRLLIVDFWASWCVPCISEFPAIKESIKRYPQIKYVFISIDKSKADWVRMMGSNSDIFNNSNSFLISEIKEKTLIKELSVTTIPRFILLDKNFRIINRNLARPSDNDFTIDIDKYLK